MAEKSAISWTDATFNPWWGCTKVSQGCKLCYADVVSNRFGWDVWGPDTDRRTFGDKHWNEPRKWDRKANKAGKQMRVFSGSMCDIFEDNIKVYNERLRLFDLIEDTPHLDWLLLTKRPENVMHMVPEEWRHLGLPDNVWMGTSVEDQENADKRIPELLNIPARIRFLSAEPLLGPINLGPWVSVYDHGFPVPVYEIQWVIVGGESQDGCRPMNIEWARDLHYQCKAFDVKFFMKQLGGHPDKHADPSEWPEDLRVQEFPE